VRLEVDARRSVKSAEVRARTNAAINVVNVASEATAEIEKLVESIGGIVEQAGNPQTSDSRRKVLEQEANQLVDEIRRKALSKSGEGVRPLAGDKFSVEVEERFAETLEVILPDTAKDAFGIGEIKFSPKDAILQTRTVIARAKEQIEQLKDSLGKTQGQVKATVDALEVALQNSEAAQTSIRDVNEALKVAGDTRIGIARNPGNALDSVGNLQKKALDLLE
jgi:flagellin-like hook-associated protein FlgL